MCVQFEKKYFEKRKKKKLKRLFVQFNRTIVTLCFKFFAVLLKNVMLFYVNLTVFKNNNELNLACCVFPLLIVFRIGAYWRLWRRDISPDRYRKMLVPWFYFLRYRSDLVPKFGIWTRELQWKCPNEYTRALCPRTGTRGRPSHLYLYDFKKSTFSLFEARRKEKSKIVGVECNEYWVLGTLVSE
jgi:hypothetical protein